MNLSSLLFGLVQVTVEGTGVNSGAGNVIINATTDDLSFWNMTLKGGWIMIPIFLLSILAVYIMVERYFAIQKAEKEVDGFFGA